MKVLRAIYRCPLSVKQNHGASMCHPDRPLLPPSKSKTRVCKSTLGLFSLRCEEVRNPPTSPPTQLHQRTLSPWPTNAQQSRHYGQGRTLHFAFDSPFAYPQRTFSSPPQKLLPPPATYLDYTGFVIQPPSAHAARRQRVFRAIVLRCRGSGYRRNSGEGVARSWRAKRGWLSNGRVDGDDTRRGSFCLRPACNTPLAGAPQLDIDMHQRGNVGRCHADTAPPAAAAAAAACCCFCASAKCCWQSLSVSGLSCCWS